MFQGFFGWDLQLSADGNLLVASSPGVIGNRHRSSENTYVYEWSSNAWIRTEILSGEGARNREGISLALSDDGSRLVIGAPHHDGNGNNAGRVRIFDNLNRLPILKLTTSLAPTTTENSLVDTLIITDPNPNETHTLAISGTDANQFRFNDDTTQLLTSGDFEIKRINSTYSFTITITDRSGLVHRQPFVLTVENLPSPPSDIELSKDSIFERLPIGTFIGTLTTTDPNDPEGEDDYTYSLTTPNDTFMISGDTLKTNRKLDFKTKNSYPLSITVTASTGLTLSKTFTIRILSAAPTDIDLSNNSLPENAPTGTIGTLTTTDPNDNDHTYSILPVEMRDTLNFQIVGNELQNRIPWTTKVTLPMN